MLTLARSTIVSSLPSVRHGGSNQQAPDSNSQSAKYGEHDHRKVPIRANARRFSAEPASGAILVMSSACTDPVKTTDSTDDARSRRLSVGSRYGDRRRGRSSTAFVAQLKRDDHTASEAIALGWSFDSLRTEDD